MAEPAVHSFAAEPLVGGFTPLTTVDFPGKLSAVLYCQGCPWRCVYCHNSHLISRSGADEVPWDDVVEFLKRRRGLLDAVVFSGGEPTLQADLGSALREVKAMGFLAGLHTGGPYPRRLARLLGDLDWVGLDVKAPPALYARITGVPGSGERAWESARVLAESTVEHEFRTTVDPRHLDEVAVLAIGRRLSRLGARRYVLQEMRTANLALPEPVPAGRSAEIFATCEAPLSALFPDFAIRRA